MQYFPDLYRFRDLNSFNRLEAMTDHFVRNYTEYDDLQSYLRGYALTGDRLATLQVPSCVLLADDDPVIPVRSLAKLHQTEALKVFLSPRGGHCGFIEALSIPSWLDNFIVHQLEDIAT
jgi:predicted alpha/beta-fold hydrolase